MNSEHDAHGLRRAMYLLLALISLSSMTGRIYAVKSQLGQTPLLSANDRSRWSTVRSIVDHGTYQIDEVILPNGKRDREWYTIDLVRHRGPDGREHYYSSKPPLLATVIAGKYWLLQKITGVTFADHPFYVGRVLLFTSNVLPMALYFLVLAILIERHGRTDWGRIFVFAAATQATFLSAFAVTLSNHLPAAVSVLLAAFAVLSIVREGNQNTRLYVAAGAFSALAVTNELPALSFFACVSVWLTWYSSRRVLIAFLPAAGLVFGAFFATNYVAHQSWRPPYAHRGDGALVATCPAELLPAAAQSPLAVPIGLAEKLPVVLSDSATFAATELPNRWVLWDPDQQRRWALVREGDLLEIREWDNWYEYEASYWTDSRRQGVDRGEASRAVYAFHSLIGHRGILSLTPIWCLSLIGAAIWLIGRDRNYQLLAGLIVVLSVICIVFYIRRPLIDRNYGGVAAGFRWMFWFAPLWLLAMIPAADWVALRRRRRVSACILLALSIFSVMYSAQNPWSQSWIFDYWTQLGWIQY